MKTPALELTDVAKEFRKDRDIVRAVDAVNLHVESGEMVVFLGPSGCGKTTTLRMIAGFELPTGGSIRIQGEDMTNTPVNKRGIGFVFQNYALFPHMSVFNNVAYGLRARGESEPGSKVQAALKLVGLAGAERRYPNQLSGGEQQRVALARVIVMEPSLLLMDEPLSNLDAKLRIYMRTEIRRIQKKLGITCLYVTHDQSEALTMADRIVVMNKGKVEQIGTPQELYGNPRSLFVADFIGQANIVNLAVERTEGETVRAAVPGGGVVSARGLVPDGASASSVYAPRNRAALIVRPESVSVGDPSGDGYKAAVGYGIFMGSHIEYELRLEDGSLLKAFVSFKNGMRVYGEGEHVSFTLDPTNALFLPA